MAFQLTKMKVELGNPIQYILNAETSINVNELIGKKIQIRWTGDIQCIECDASTKTSFGQGFCYKCFTSAAQASPCIIKPELCRAHLGEGRDIEWEQRNHNQPHVVYLASTDTTKVGVTRSTQIPTRWIDQGAHQVIKVAETPNRYLAGVLEVALKEHFTDKTNWQKMLKNEIDPSIDLINEKWSLEEVLPEDLTQYFTEDDTILELEFPVTTFPTKIKSISLEKEALIEGELSGIKVQYLLFNDQRVINLRKYTGYIIEFNAIP